MNVTCEIEQAKFSRPMPWIGLYVAAASLACALAMAGDIIFGLRHRKLWFPCRYFSLNATSLALLAIAMKVPVDLSTPMRMPREQLTKLSGTVLICTVMSNFMPSLGTMEESQVILNVVPLGILVITIFVNICIEMSTCVIYSLLPEHIIILFFMLIMLLILVSSALAVPTMKQLLKQQYELRCQQVSDDKVETLGLTELKNDVRKCWMIAYSCNPQYVLCRSTMCTASGFFCLLGVFVLIVAFIRSCVLGYHNFQFPCKQASDYKWSTLLILVSQGIAVGVGSVAPVCRWFQVVHCRAFHMKTRSDFKREFKVERYWIQRLAEWKECPLSFDIGSRCCRKIVHGLQNLALDACLNMQMAIVFSSKFVRVASILSVNGIKRAQLCLACNVLPWILKSSRSPWNEETGLSSEAEIRLRDFVLHLEGEEAFIQPIINYIRVDPEKWIHRGRKSPPIHLMELLKKSTMSLGFNGVDEFDSYRVPSLASEEPPNCWTLPLVTLMSITIAITGTDQDLVESLLRGVNEGLRYVRLVEKKLDMKGLVNIREAADIIWLGIDLYHRWLDVDLHRLAREEKDAKKTIRLLVEIGKQCISEFEKSETAVNRKKTIIKWPAKALAGNSMYRIGQTILEDYDSKFGTVDKLLEWLQVTISDILGACLTNLPHAISMECFGSAIEAKEDSIREVACLLGKAEKILETLRPQAIEELGSNHCAYIDDWRLNRLKKNTSCLQSATSNSNMASFSSGELHLSIE